MLGTVLALVGFLSVPIAMIGVAAMHNRIRYGFWFSRWSGTAKPPLPFEQLSATDRDAWSGGSGGN